MLLALYKSKMCATLENFFAKIPFYREKKLNIAAKAPPTGCGQFDHLVELDGF